MPDVTEPPADKISFYSTTGLVGCFSNFSRHPVKLKGKIWPTSEHYYQAQKFAGTPHEEAIRNAPSPKVAANMGRDRSKKLRRDWESGKEDVMYRVVLAKFLQHDDIRQTLLATGEAVLVEHTERDSYWGDGGDGSGKNRLGHILMRVRADLRGT